MGMKEIYGNASYKIMQVTLSEGAIMPQHSASSDAFIMVEKGSAVISFREREVVLEPGSSFPIPANEAHQLRVLKDFNAFVVMAAEGRIQFADQ